MHKRYKKYPQSNVETVYNVLEEVFTKSVLGVIIHAVGVIIDTLGNVSTNRGAKEL